MDFDSYQAGCLKTEAPIDDGVRQRYKECSDIIYRMLQGYESEDFSDSVKKYVFYGKLNSVDLKLTLENNARYGSPPNENLPADDKTIRLVHCWLGMTSEIPELGEAILKGDPVNIAEEIQDSGWYASIGLDAIGVKASDSASANLAKLKARYPDRFSQESAINRDLGNEAGILADHLLTE